MNKQRFAERYGLLYGKDVLLYNVHGVDTEIFGIDNKPLYGLYINEVWNVKSKYPHRQRIGLDISGDSGERLGVIGTVICLEGI